MIQCKDCPRAQRSADGSLRMKCDPFATQDELTVLEPECLQKWQLIKINQMVASYQATLDYYRKLAPLQEKMFKAMERELEDMSESDKWKAADDEEETDPAADRPKADDWDPDKFPFQ